MRSNRWRSTAAPALAALLIICAGGAAVASNMAFKMRYALYPPNAAFPGRGDNWISLPFNRPYVTYANLCSQVGLPNVTTRIFQVNPETGASQQCVCGTAGCTQLSLDLSNLPPAQLPGGVPAPYLAVQIRNAGFVAGVASAVIVGSHNPAQSILLRRIPSAVCGDVVGGASVNIGATWVSIPLHSTAVTVQDLCVQLGVPPGPSATVQIVNPQVGTLTVTCNTAGAINTPLLWPYAVRVRRTTAGPCAPIASIPATF